MHHIERHSTDSTLWISSMAGLQLRHVPSKYLESKYIVSKYVHNTGCIIRYYTTIRIIHNTAAFWPYCCTLVGTGDYDRLKTVTNCVTLQNLRN